MRFGLTLPHYGFSLPGRPASHAATAGWAARAEDLGFDSVWVSDHFVFSLGRYGGDPGPVDALEPLTALAGIAAGQRGLRLAAIKAMQDQLFYSRYAKHGVIAVGNGFPAWEDTMRVVSVEHAESAAREPIFRLVARQVAPAQPGTFVVWDKLRLEGGDAPKIGRAHV